MGGSIIIFVQGDVTINTNITLANGAFFAIDASGNITVAPAVGNAAAKANPTAADANLTGAFFANGNFTGGTTGSQTDKQLVIYGTIAADIDLGANGGNSVNFQQDLEENNNYPGVSVIWNPNLLLNFPDQLTDALTDWPAFTPTLGRGFGEASGRWRRRNFYISLTHRQTGEK